MVVHKSLSLTEERYVQLTNDYAGYCTHCNKITEESGVEPDAMHYVCPVCEKNTIYGVEQAFIAGYIKFKEAKAKPVKVKDTSKVLGRTSPTIEQLVELIPSELNGKEIRLEARISYAEGIIANAATIDLIPMTGWKTCGQWIVYGLENKLGFHTAANLCSLVEKDYNRMKSAGNVDLPGLKKMYAEHYLTLAFKHKI